MELSALKAHLGAQLSEFASGLQQNSQTGRILGFVVSSAFESLNHAQRQDLLRRTLEMRFSPADLARHLGPVVAMTPTEAAVTESVE